MPKGVAISPSGPAQSVWKVLWYGKTRKPSSVLFHSAEAAAERTPRKSQHLHSTEPVSNILSNHNAQDQ